MKTIRTIWLMLCSCCERREVKREIDEELRFHLEQRTAENITAGMAPEEAAREARRRFGNLQSLREQCREARGASFGEPVLRDIRLGLRVLRKNPGFTAVAMLTLALGIGANTAIFSLVHGVLLRPLPYRGPDRLVYLREVVPALAQTYPTVPVSARHFVEWRQRCTSFESLSAIHLGNASLCGAGEPRRLEVARVSANLFDMLGVRPALGRGFAGGEDRAGQDGVVVISDSLWRQVFHADPTIMGKTLTLDKETQVIVGVLPAWFCFPAASAFDFIGATDREPPEVFKPKVFSPDEMQELMGQFNYLAIGRLKSGVPPAMAMEELNVIAAQLVKLSGEKLELRAAVTPLQAAVVGKSQRGLWLLSGAVGAVLLIACLNLAMLMLARAEQRGHESAVCKALGASRTQLLGQALTETMLLSLLGGLLGVGLAAAGLGSLLRVAPVDIPRLDEVRLDGTVLLFALGLTVMTGLLFGLLPAWRMAKAEPQNALKSRGQPAPGPRGGLSLRDALIMAEVGFSVLLLVAGALLMNSFLRLARADQGFSAPAALAAEVALPDSLYGEHPEKRSQLLERLLENLSSAPGVSSAAIVSVLPLDGEYERIPSMSPARSKTNLRRRS